MKTLNEIEQYYQENTEWMNKYIKSFYNDNKEIQEGISIKEVHTKKVASISGVLAGHLQLNKHDVILAQIIGLFHDIGRFKQFTIYKTFNDALSENHALLGLKVLQEYNLLERLSPDDRQLLEFAIRNHNAKQIEQTKDKRQLLFAKIIRDADKLDIFRVLRPYLTTGDIEPCSAVFVEQFKNGGQCDYKLIRTQNDRKLVRLLWIYDINFSWTLSKIVSQGYVEEIINSLPQTADMKIGFGVLKNYISQKLKQPDMPVVY